MCQAQRIMSAKQRDLGKAQLHQKDALLQRHRLGPKVYGTHKAPHVEQIDAVDVDADVQGGGGDTFNLFVQPMLDQRKLS